jgi:hypothetical protein
MTIKENGMKFPVLHISDTHIAKIQNQERLGWTSQKYYDMGGLKKNTRLIDIDGNEYVVENVVKRRRSWNPLNWLAPSPIILVNLYVSRQRKMAFEQIRNCVLDKVIKKKWFRQGGQNETQFRDMINETKTIAELFEKISFYGKFQG